MTIFVALDSTNLEFCHSIARKIRDYHHAADAHTYGIKIGLELFCAHGSEGVRSLKEYDLPIFLDLKLHDISNTVIKTLDLISRLDIDLTTVHSACGFECLNKIAQQKFPMKIIGVTALTSFDELDLQSINIKDSLEDHVKFMSQICNETIDGIVCSPHETKIIKNLHPNLLVVNPGIRMSGDNSQDQKRTSTPSQARKNGADFLVIGRSITEARNIQDALRRIELDN